MLSPRWTPAACSIHLTRMLDIRGSTGYRDAILQAELRFPCLMKVSVEFTMFKKHLFAKPSKQVNRVLNRRDLGEGFQRGFLNP
jgi:hypothetical protein